jgi:predicted sulfurtransferase
MEGNIQSLSNSQLEILKTFRYDLNEKDLKKFRKMLVRFFAEIVMDEADEVWDKEEWDEAKVEEMLNTKMRKRG